MRRFLVLGITLLFGSSAHGRLFIITNKQDSHRRGSLRAAVIEANRGGGERPNLIVLPSGTYLLNITGADEDSSRTGDLDITHGNLAIVGLGTNVTIDATGLGDRVFQGFPRAHLALSHLTIKGGSAPQAQFGSFYSPARGAENGGAIYNEGVLVLDHCVFTNNSSGAGNGNPGNGGGQPGANGGGIS